MDLYQTDENISNSIQLVKFSVGKENYGLHIEQVQEIIRITKIIHLPKTKDYLKGIINLRGIVIPIIDMRTKFSMESMDYSELSRVIVINMNENLVGIIVDSVSNVIELPENKIEAPQEIVHGLSKEYIDGIGKINGNMIIILNIYKVLTAQKINKLDEKAGKKARKKKR